MDKTETKIVWVINKRQKSFWLSGLYLSMPFHILFNLCTRQRTELYADSEDDCENLYVSAAQRRKASSLPRSHASVCAHVIHSKISYTNILRIFMYAPTYMFPIHIFYVKNTLTRCPLLVTQISTLLVRLKTLSKIKWSETTESSSGSVTQSREDSRLRTWSCILYPIEGVHSWDCHSLV